mmetsp:Transcript_26256/g.61020  ORF Transcript_26256/g.61020 Transcript_26256/m.61020 type:complete len:92 (-) Transcript_26256:44-319(-)
MRRGEVPTVMPSRRRMKSNVFPRATVRESTDYYFASPPVDPRLDIFLADWKGPLGQDGLWCVLFFLEICCFLSKQQEKETLGSFYLHILTY